MTTTYGDGLRTTRAVLSAWNEAPGRILRRWLWPALAAAVLLLAAVLLTAAVEPARGTVFLDQPPLQVGDLLDVREIVSRNLLVLALHAMACVAGFIAGSSLPQQARALQGRRRTLHRWVSRGGIAFVVTATVVSLVIQTLTIGGEAARVAAVLHTSPPRLLLALLPHAVPELTALFLPLAAWLRASRRREWDELLAATAVTVAVAIPVLLVCAFWEVYAAPHVIATIAGRA